MFDIDWISFVYGAAAFTIITAVVIIVAWYLSERRYYNERWEETVSEEKNIQ